MLEQFGYRHVRDVLDLCVRIDEGQVEQRRELAPHRRFAGAHQTDKHDGPRTEAVMHRVANGFDFGVHGLFPSLFRLAHEPACAVKNCEADRVRV